MIGFIFIQIFNDLNCNYVSFWKSMFYEIFQSFIIYKCLITKVYHQNYSKQDADTMDFVLLRHRSLLWNFLRQTKVNRDTLAIAGIILTIMQNKSMKSHSKLKKNTKNRRNKRYETIKTCNKYMAVLTLMSSHRPDIFGSTVKKKIKKK